MTDTRYYSKAQLTKILRIDSETLALWIKELEPGFLTNNSMIANIGSGLDCYYEEPIKQALRERRDSERSGKTGAERER